MFFGNSNGRIAHIGFEFGLSVIFESRTSCRQRAVGRLSTVVISHNLRFAIISDCLVKNDDSLRRDQQEQIRRKEQRQRCCSELHPHETKSGLQR